MRRFTARRRVAGFTLIETMVSLTIIGLTLGLMLSYTNFGVATAFKFGDRALYLADQQITRDSFRALVNDLLIPSLEPTETVDLNGELVDETFFGEPEQFSAYLIASRGTPCAPQGTIGRLTLSVTTQGRDNLVICQIDDLDPIVLMNLKIRPARFQYSDDRINWYDTWTVVRGEQILDSATPDAELRKVYIRLSTNDDQMELVELAASGRDVPIRAANAANQVPN